MIGADAKLYYGAAPLAGEPSTGDWTELDIVKDVTLGRTFDEVDQTTRRSAKRKEVDQGLEDNALEYTIAYEPADPGYLALEAAYSGRLPIAMAVMGGDIETAGTKGLAGNWKIFKFEESQPLSGHVVVNISMKPYSLVVPYEV
jgi:hypothetical protein